LSRGSLSTTSNMPRVRVPRHVARLVVNYFTYSAHLVASARRAACRVTHRRLLRLAQAHHRLLRLRHLSGCLSTSHGSSSTTPPCAGSSSTTSTTPLVRLLRHVARLVAWLVVDYFASVARPGASARRAARHAARRRLLRLAQARCRPLRLHRASGCLGTSRVSSSTTLPRAGSSSTTLTTPRVRLHRHVARLVIDYFASAARPGASTRHVAHCRLLRLRRASGCFGTSCGTSRRSL
jgi:hypothetical protein